MSYDHSFSFVMQPKSWWIRFGRAREETRITGMGVTSRAGEVTVLRSTVT